MRYFFIVIITLCCLVSTTAEAVLDIDITRGTSKNMVISVLPFFSSTNLETDLAKKIITIFKVNLSNTGLFEFKDKPYDIKVNDQAIPLSNLWHDIKSDILMTFGVVETEKNKVEIKLRLWDIVTTKQLMAKSLIFEIKNWRRAGHMISDMVYHRLTGEKGYFDTKIAYIAETGSVPKITRRIALMDQDGANTFYLTDGRRFVFMPRFSPDARKIAYMSYIKGGGRVLLRDLSTNKETILGNFKGINLASHFSPDGKSILMSESLRGRTNIYDFNLKSQKAVKLTNNIYINTSGSYSPDKNFIVFNSDRTGSQQLYVMKADGSNQRRISFGGGSYADPVWSPRGDWIAFTKIKSGKFFIGVMKPNGTGERLLASGYLVEAPTWSPNGRVIVFTREYPPVKGKNYIITKLCSIDLTGANERIIPTPARASSASWSNALNY